MRGLLVLTVAFACAGCVSKYRHPGETAKRFAAEYFNCSEDAVFVRPLNEGYLADCGQRQAICDSYGGRWSCTGVDPAEEVAGRAVAAQTGCQSIKRLAITELSQTETVVRLGACGAVVECEVTLQGKVGCRVLQKAPDVDDEVKIEPCEPKCRSGFTCADGKCVPHCGVGQALVKGACVSACNPACGKGERCTDSGECER